MLNPLSTPQFSIPPHIGILKCTGWYLMLGGRGGFLYLGGRDYPLKNLLVLRIRSRGALIGWMEKVAAGAKHTLPSFTPLAGPVPSWIESLLWRCVELRSSNLKRPPRLLPRCIYPYRRHPRALPRCIYPYRSQPEPKESHMLLLFFASIEQNSREGHVLTPKKTAPLRRSMLAPVI